VPSLLHVVARELPVVLGQIDAPQEPSALLLLGQVEEELDDPEAVLGQVALPLVDRVVAVLPDVVLASAGRQLLGHEVLRVHANEEHLLVVGAVEDADLAAGGQARLVAAQVVLVELSSRGHLEALHAYPLRGFTPLMT
jgi:hypothetical protein